MSMEEFVSKWLAVRGREIIDAPDGENVLTIPASPLALAKKRVLDWEKTSNASTIIVEMRF